jgi:RimJ/RimL family protein N-acetyltransferase
MSDRNLISRLKNEIAKHGIPGLIQKLTNKVSAFLFYTTSSVWYERNLDVLTSHLTPEITLNTEFLIHDKSKLVEWLIENKSKYPWIYFEKEIETALRHDHVFLIILHQNKIISYVKIGIGPTYIHDFNQVLDVQARTAFVYDTFTLPEYRGKSLALFALDQAVEYFKTRNFKRILCHIESWNIPSIKTFEKAGFRAINSIRFVRTARFSFFIRGGYIPFINLKKQLNQLSTYE